MPRIHTVLTLCLIVVVCLVAQAYPTTGAPPHSLTQHHKASGATVKWSRGKNGALKDTFHMRLVSRQKRQLKNASNWLKRLYHRTKWAAKKFFQSKLWGKYRYTMSVSSVFLFMSATLDTYLKIIGLGDIGSIATYMDLLWISYDVLTELKDLADEKCYYPTYWPIYKLAPDHCNPYKELQQLLEEADKLCSETGEGTSSVKCKDEAGHT